MSKNILLFIILIITITISCSEKEVKKSDYELAIEAFRHQKDSIMAFSPTSPFNAKNKIKFHPLKYFSIDTTFIYKSKLYKYSTSEPVTIYGTQGEKRRAERFGYFKINKDSNSINLNVYRIATSDSTYYYAVWFTDKTTGKLTYGVGRYLDIEYEKDENYIYTIDFNKAYNPWCSYNPSYSCAVPTKKDHIELAITAGERNFH